MKTWLAIIGIVAGFTWTVRLSAQDQPANASKVLAFQPEGPSGSFVGCLRPVLEAAGEPWTAGNLRAFLGSASAFSMNPNGGPVWQAGNYEWSYIFTMLSYFGESKTDYSGTLKGEHPLTPEEFQKLRRQAWDSIRQSIDAGMPAILWAAFTPELKASGRKDLPYMWSLVVGYDDATQTYRVRHAGSGEFSVRWDEVGHTDPVNWFCAILFKPKANLVNLADAHRAALQRIIDASAGQRPGSDDASAHGMNAWNDWLAAFRANSVDTSAIHGHANYLIQSRGDLAAYLRYIQTAMPASSHPRLDAVAKQYDSQVDALKRLQALANAQPVDFEQCAAILEEVIAAEKSILEGLAQAIQSN